MKKVLSVILAIVMLVAVFAVPAYATSEDSAPEWKYYDKLVEYCDRGEPPVQYAELFYYYSDENLEEPDWSLILAPFTPKPWEVKEGILVGDRIISSVGGCDTSFTAHYVYISEIDSIVELERNNYKQILEICPEFVEALEENNIGQQFGDVDDDGKITIFDATYIQRFLAEYYDFIQTYYRVNLEGGYAYVPDFNRDGETTILDATCIQRKLAKFENYLEVAHCIK